jgi:hypothetical protein
MNKKEKELKRHNTKLEFQDYLKLKGLQTKLMELGMTEITLNDVLTGCIRYVEKKGVTNNDRNFFGSSSSGTE